MCVGCGFRFTTYERIERPQLIVIKKDHSRELFDRNKISSGLFKACEKTTISTMEIESLVNKVEHSLYDCGDSEVESSRIGEIIMDNLSELNEVAYVRFASVYRRFKDIASFEKELTRIRSRSLVK
jgi:transcriptional repressor NrdR